MGTGASTIKEDTKREFVRELYAPKPDQSDIKSKKKARGPVELISSFLNDDTSADTYNQRNNSVDMQGGVVRPFQLDEEPVSISMNSKHNNALMKRLVYETIPDFLSYTVEDPTGSDLEAANAARQKLGSPAHYLEFYTTVYENLHEASAKYSFSIRTITFKNDFLTELMRMVVLETPSKLEYSTIVAQFGIKYSQENIALVEYGLFGEAIILAMRKVQKGLRFDLWPRAYSRFVRALLPAVLIANATISGAPTSSSTNNTTTTATAVASSYTVVKEASAVSGQALLFPLPAEVDQLAPPPGSTEQLHLAYSLSRIGQPANSKSHYNTNNNTLYDTSPYNTSLNTTYNANQTAFQSTGTIHPFTLNRAPSIKKVTFCEESGTSCSDL